MSSKYDPDRDEVKLAGERETALFHQEVARQMFLSDTDGLDDEFNPGSALDIAVEFTKDFSDREAVVLLFAALVDICQEAMGEQASTISNLQRVWHDGTPHPLGGELPRCHLVKNNAAKLSRTTKQATQLPTLHGDTRSSASN